MLDPDVIVLGGGLSNIAKLYDELPARIATYAFSRCHRHADNARPGMGTPAECAVPRGFGRSSDQRRWIAWRLRAEASLERASEGYQFT